MAITRRRRAMFFFVALGVCTLASAIVLNVTWIIVNWRSFIALLIGIPFFLLLIAGLVLNTVFLVREVRQNERQNSFLNVVTHELKTPIASIRLYLETLQRHEVPEEKRREFYGIMLSDSERLLATVEQVLKAGEVGQRTRNQVRLHIDLDEVVHEAIDTTLRRHHLDESAIEFIPGGLEMTTEGNPEDLRTATLNILDNAVKYSLAKPRIKVRLQARGDAWLALAVTDQGLGIAPANLKRIFKRFYRVPARNVFRVKGTGLGLFLVRSIARQHGGDAYAESPGEGQGATVVMLLPRSLQPVRLPVEADA